MIHKNIRNLVPSATLRINEYSKKLEKQGKEIFKLGFGQSPFPVPEVMVKALQNHAHEKAYLPVRGLEELRNVVAKYYQRTQNLNCTTDNILIAPGSKMYLFIVQAVYDADLILPEPSWVSYAPQAQILGRKAHWIGTSEANNWKLVPDDLDQFCQKSQGKKILLLNYPSNPTGTTYSVSELKELALIARKHDILIMSDEIYGELNFKGNHVSIAQFCPERTIITSGLSKWAGAGGWRVGTVVVPNELKLLQNAITVMASETFTTVSAPIQYGAVPAFEDTASLELYRQTARKILSFIGNDTFQKLQNMDITTPQPEGGFYSFINFENHRGQLLKRGITTSIELSNSLLKEIGIALLPGVDFGKKANELLFRMAFVDFDGKQAMNVAMNNYTNQKLDQLFLDQCAPKMMKAMTRLDNWLRK